MNHIAVVLCRQILFVETLIIVCTAGHIFIHLVFLVLLEMKGTLVKLKYEPAATTFTLGSVACRAGKRRSQKLITNCNENMNFCKPSVRP